MVSIGFTADHKLPAIFVPNGVKINAIRYQTDILDVMLPRLNEKDPNYIFQQDGAPAHTARSTVQYLEERCPGRFLEPNIWPPSSPDLNPCDYYLWSALEQKVYRGAQIKDVEDLKRRILAAWDELPQAGLEKAILKWRARLRAVSRARGGHIEHQMH
jgi:DDE superfamily endonuclease